MKMIHESTLYIPDIINICNTVIDNYSYGSVFPSQIPVCDHKMHQYFKILTIHKMRLNTNFYWLLSTYDLLA